jgi:hypothetical protein
MILGDGYTKNNSSEYYTGSEQLANDVQKLCIHAGYSGKMTIKHKKGENLEIKGNNTTRNSNQYRISIIKNKNYLEPLISNKTKTTIVELINKNCKVYCPTVSTGIFMVRRNGKTYWTGNSSRSG